MKTPNKAGPKSPFFHSKIEYQIVEKKKIGEPTKNLKKVINQKIAKIIAQLESQD